MVLKNYDVENVLMPDVTSSTMTFGSLLDAIEGSNASVEVVSAGVYIFCRNAEYDRFCRQSGSKL